MRLRLLVLCCTLFSLTSCLEILETFTINENTGGTYEVKTDFSKAMTMMAAMGGGKNARMPRVMDSSVSFRSVLDTVTMLTPAEKAALGKGSIRIHLDEPKGEMYLMMQMPFSDAKEYNLIHGAMGKMKNMKAMEGAVKALFGETDAQPGTDQMSPGSSMPTDNFEYMLSANQLQRKVKPVNGQGASQAPPEDMPEELKEMFKIDYTTVINLPRAVKKITGTEGKLSSDKKQVKFSRKVDISGGLLPADFDFSIDF